MKRLYNLDTLKCIAVLMVIYIHTQSNEYILLITRTAVPIFFLISGFFYTPMSFNKQIRKLLSFTCIFLLIYIIIQLTIHGKIFLTNLFTIKNAIDFFLVNSTTCVGEPLWYLPASIYALTILHFIVKRKKTTILFITIPLLLIINTILANTGHIARYRNFLFTGLPYITIGYFIAQYKSIIREKLIRISPIFMLLILLTLSYSEYLIYQTLKLTYIRDHYISTTFLSVYIFILASLILKQKRTAYISYIGQNLSGIIYGIHFLIVPFVFVFFPKLSSIRFIIVFLISTAIAFLINKVISTFKN